MSESSAVQRRLVAVALEISARRAEILERLREAVEREDKDDVFQIAIELVGANREQKSSRTDSDAN